MTKKQEPTRVSTRFLREGDYAAEVEVTLIGDDDPLGWGPYLTPKDAQKLDDVRKALRANDTSAASKLAIRVYALTPVAAE